MSRAYRITVKESDTRDLKAGGRDLHASWKSSKSSRPRTWPTLLTEELKKRGFEEQDDGTLVRKDGERDGHRRPVLRAR